MLKKQNHELTISRHIHLTPDTNNYHEGTRVQHSSKLTLGPRSTVKVVGRLVPDKVTNIPRTHVPLLTFFLLFFFFFLSTGEYFHVRRNNIRFAIPRFFIFRFSSFIVRPCFLFSVFTFFSSSRTSPFFSAISSPPPLSTLFMLASAKPQFLFLFCFYMTYLFLDTQMLSVLRVQLCSMLFGLVQFSSVLFSPIYSSPVRLGSLQSTHWTMEYR